MLLSQYDLNRTYTENKNAANENNEKKEINLIPIKHHINRILLLKTYALKLTSTMNNNNEKKQQKTTLSYMNIHAHNSHYILVQ